MPTPGTLPHGGTAQAHESGNLDEKRIVEDLSNLLPKQLQVIMEFGILQVRGVRQHLDHPTPKQSEWHPAFLSFGDYLGWMKAPFAGGLRFLAGTPFGWHPSVNLSHS